MTLSIYANESEFNFYVNRDSSITISYEKHDRSVYNAIVLNKEQFDRLVKFINESMNDVDLQFKK